MLLILVGCSDNEQGWNDVRYKENFAVSIFHTNPDTGKEYTAAELEKLTYDPKVKESYNEEQSVDLSVVTEKELLEVKVLLGSNLSVLKVITESALSEGKYKTSSFVTSLEELNLLEIGDKAILKFEILYKDKSIGATFFEVKKKKKVDPNQATVFFVFLKKQVGALIGLVTDEVVTSKTIDPQVGHNVSFNGTNSQVSVNNIPELSFRYAGDFSIGLWVKTTATNSDPSIIGDKNWASGTNKGFVFTYLGSKWKLNAGGGTGRVDLTGNPINDGKWHFLVATFDRDGKATIYQDGVSVASASMTSLVDMNSGYPIHLAQDGTGNYGDWFNGNIGDTFIYDYVLTPEQVATASILKM